MINALLSTPTGQLAHLARVNRGGLCSEIAAAAARMRTTLAQLWLVHPDATPDLIEGMTPPRVAPIAGD